MNGCSLLYFTSGDACFVGNPLKVTENVRAFLQQGHGVQEECFSCIDYPNMTLRGAPK